MKEKMEISKYPLLQEKSIIKKKLAKLLIPALLFIACPGDDIAMLAAVTSPLAGQMETDVTPILELYWISNRSERMKIKEPEIPKVEKCNDFKEECVSITIFTKQSKI